MHNSIDDRFVYYFSEFDNYYFDSIKTNQRLYKNDKEIDLTKTELKLLILFLNNKNKTILYEDFYKIFSSIKYNDMDKNLIRQHIYRLKTKTSMHISSHSGKGYRLIEYNLKNNEYKSNIKNIKLNNKTIDKDTLISMYKNGIKIKDMAIYFNCSLNNILSRLYRHVTPNRKKRGL